LIFVILLIYKYDFTYKVCKSHDKLNNIYFIILEVLFYLQSL